MHTSDIGHSAACEPLSSPILSCAPHLSPWTRSGAKRLLDIGLVLAFSPVLLPLLTGIATAVLLTSGLPIIFLQERMGRNGALFRIYKFRTMRPADLRPLGAVSVESNHRITQLGRWLRKLKLDELPQLVNVMKGEMSLVGPRPKVPQQQPDPLPCRPGLTGPATLMFAREEALLHRIAPEDLVQFFHRTILPAKRRLDAQYLRRATIWSDIRILVDTLLGRWGSWSGEMIGSTGYKVDFVPNQDKAQETA